MTHKITSVPTHVITGFLGVGKTTAILQLLKHKPANERWAILVNEFGDIGVDGSLLEGQTVAKNLFIREVPGGCMCCAAGVPMQIALNQLLLQAKPDRVLIEPTGLGHPKEVLRLLSAEVYRDVLSLQKTVTLVDARNLTDHRYTTHETFNQQIAIADVIVGNKVDLYLNDDKKNLFNYVKQYGLSHSQVYFTQQGRISLAQLTGQAVNIQDTDCHSAHNHKHDHNEHRHGTFSLTNKRDNQPLPPSGFIKAINTGEGFVSMGWRFSPENVFNHGKLQTLLSGIDAERIKATFLTETGSLGYNITPDSSTETLIHGLTESRIEIIMKNQDDTIEHQLMACLIS